MRLRHLTHTPRAALSLNYVPDPLMEGDNHFYVRPGSTLDNTDNLSSTTARANGAFTACVDLLANSVSMAEWKLTNSAGDPASKALHDEVRGRMFYWRVFVDA